MTHPIWLLAGALAGYLLMMRTNPVRACLRDGLRTIQRYRAMWVLPGAFGFCYALFQLGLRYYFSRMLPAGESPIFRWTREGGAGGIAGASDVLWRLAPGELTAAAKSAVLPAIESAAALFNVVVSTFPLAAIAAFLFLINSGNHHAVLVRALRRRFGSWAWAAHAGIIVCATAALLKPIAYAIPRLVNGELWFQWSPVLVWLAFLFEYLFGVCLQIYLILLAYCWVRGLSFTHKHLVDFAIRRFSFVVRWAAVVMVLSSVFIDIPLILKNFTPFASLFPSDWEITEHRVQVARTILGILFLLCATIQITLTFHSESLRKAFIGHLQFVRRHAWPLIWFLVLAAIHFFMLHTVNLASLRGWGEGTALWVVWILLFPWLAGIMSAWLLASWVSFYKRCETGRLRAENWIQF